MMHRLFTLCVAATLLAGCGFHLRGSQPMPEVMEKTLLVVSGNSPLYYELESLLLAAGSEVMKQAEGATAVLRVQSAVIESRTLSLDPQGRASGYSLLLSVKYSLRSVEGEALSDALITRVERDYRFDPDNVLAQGAEREMVERGMYRVAAQQMLRRLRSESVTPPLPSHSEPAEAQ